MWCGKESVLKLVTLLLPLFLITLVAPLLFLCLVFALHNAGKCVACMHVSAPSQCPVHSAASTPAFCSPHPLVQAMSRDADGNCQPSAVIQGAHPPAGAVSGAGAGVASRPTMPAAGAHAPTPSQWALGPAGARAFAPPPDTQLAPHAVSLMARSPALDHFSIIRFSDLRQNLQGKIGK